MDLKKILTIIIVVLLISVGVSIVIGSNKDRNVIFVDNFHKSIENRIQAKENKNYVYQIVKVKGYTNDTIIIIPCEACKPVKLQGKINEKFQKDFYEGTSKMRFDPYEATEGDLKIIHKIR